MEYIALNIGLTELMLKERFWAELLTRFKIEPNTKRTTAAVRVTKDGIILDYNPYWLNQFVIPGKTFKKEEPLGAIASVLKHECEHVWRDHFGRSITLEPELYKEKTHENVDDYITDYFESDVTSKLLNWAADLEINEANPGIPKNFNLFDENGNIVLDDEGKPYNFTPISVEILRQQHPHLKIKNNMPMEYYYQFLKGVKDELNNKQGKSGKHLTSLDTHLPNSLDKETAREIIKAALNGAYNALSDGDRASLSSDIKELMSLVNNSNINWKRQLKQFASNASSFLVESTRRRRNRRYGLKYPGRRKEPISHIWYVRDTSGSMWTEEIQTKIEAELIAISEAGANITVIDVDTDIRQVYTFEKSIKKRKNSLGGGGTCFAPAFLKIKDKEFINEWGKPDGIIYATDGENFDEVSKPTVPVLWLLLEGHQSRYDWGKKVYINTK